MNHKIRPSYFVLSGAGIFSICLALALLSNLRFIALASRAASVASPKPTPAPTPTPFPMPTPYVVLHSASTLDRPQVAPYEPSFHKIPRLWHVPPSIRRVAASNKRSRFFGTFAQDGQRYALHFYDQSRVYAKRESDSTDFERHARLDVFVLNSVKRWHRIQSRAVICLLNDRRGQVLVEAQWLSLNPKRQTLPLVYLRVRAPSDHDWSYGNQTDAYGVLLPTSNPQTFITFDNYNPLLCSTITSSRVSFPDANGNLTIVFTASNPGYDDCQAYGWTGKGWRLVASAHSQNDESARTWNGSQFVPLFPKHPGAMR